MITLTRRIVVSLLVVAATTLPASILPAHELSGIASWYAGKFQGRLTASGEVFDTAELTAAHKTLPFGTVVEVTNLLNDLVVQVRINDRGPFVDGRIIDLSRAAADSIDMTGRGVAPVQLGIVSWPAPRSRSVQIASFSVPANADRVVAHLRDAGLDAEVERPETTTGVYRVVITGVSDGEIDGILEELASLGYNSVLVRSR